MLAQRVDEVDQIRAELGLPQLAEAIGPIALPGCGVDRSLDGADHLLHRLTLMPEGHPELLELSPIVLGMVDELNMHLLKEERVLFPDIEALAAATGPVAERAGQERLRRLERDAAVRLERQDQGLED